MARRDAEDPGPTNPPVDPTENLVELAKKLLMARGYRVTQVGESRDADTVAAREKEEADAARAGEAQTLAAFKEAAAAYVIEE